MPVYIYCCMGRELAHDGLQELFELVCECNGMDEMGGWFIPLRLFRPLEHLLCSYLISLLPFPGAGEEKDDRPRDPSS